MSERPLPDLSRLRIDRDARPRRRWTPWLLLAAIAAAGLVAFPRVRATLAERRAPEVDVARVQRAAEVTAGGADALPVLVATGYVVARRTSDVGVKVGGRLETMEVEEGSAVRRGEVIARIEHADLDAQLAAARAEVAQAETALAEAEATRDEDQRDLERQRALAADGITTDAALTAAQAAAQVSAARVKAADAAIATARAQVAVVQEALENTNVRAPFDGVVVRKRAEVGETVSPFGVAGQAAREGGAIATIADLTELEVQAEVGEANVAKLASGLPAIVTLQAYQGETFQGRVRQIFPAADRAKAIVEVRVSILDADARVKPDMTASVTFLEPRARPAPDGAPGADQAAASIVALAPRRAIVERGGERGAWVVVDGRVEWRPVRVGPERLDQIEVREGLAPGEAVVLSPPGSLEDGGLVRIKGA
jgi:RND family efflux transporter MFP subunit